MEFDVIRYFHLPKHEEKKSVFARTGHSVTINNQYLYMSGGVSNANVDGFLTPKEHIDLYRIKLLSNNPKWEKVKNKGKEIPICRISHSFESSKKFLYLFGGYCYIVLNDCWKFDLKKNIWIDLIMKGTPPKRRSNAMSVMKSPGVMIVFGGLGQAENSRLNDTFLIDYNNNKYISLKTINDPPPQRSSVIAYKNEKLYIFSGQVSLELGKIHNDIYCLNFKNLTWNKIEIQNNNIKPPKRLFSTGGIINNKLIIYGGRKDKDREGSKKNDSYEYDFTKMKWKKIKYKNFIPKTVSGHCSTIFDDRFLIVYGGISGGSTHESKMSDIIIFKYPNFFDLKFKNLFTNDFNCFDDIVIITK